MLKKEFYTLYYHLDPNFEVLIPKTLYDSYISRLIKLFPFNTYHTYDEYIRCIQKIPASKYNLTLSIWYDALGVCCLSVRSSCFWAPLYFTEGAIGLIYALPPVVPEYFEEYLNDHPNTGVMTSQQEYFSIVPKCNNIVYPNYIVKMPSSIEDYATSLSKRNRQEFNKHLRERVTLSLKQVDYSTLFRCPIFARYYDSYSAMRPVLFDRTHINSSIMLSTNSLGKPIAFELYDSDILVGVNIGFIRDNKYNDSIFIPYTTKEVFRNKHYGIKIIYELLIHFMGSDITEYILGIEGTYKNKFLTKNAESKLNFDTYDSYTQTFLASSKFIQEGFNPPFYLNKIGWVKTKEEVLTYIKSSERKIVETIITRGDALNLLHAPSVLENINLIQDDTTVYVLGELLDSSENLKVYLTLKSINNTIVLPLISNYIVDSIIKNIGDSNEG